MPWFPNSTNPQSHQSEAGFTLNETLIAVAIFGSIAILCLAMFVWAGRIYYRGLHETRTQEIARSVVDNISEAISTSGVVVKALECTDLSGSPLSVTTPCPAVDSTTNPHWKGYCVGNIKYSYRLHTQLVPDSGSSSHRLAEKVFIRSQPCNASSTVTPTGDKQEELLSDKMRLVDFGIRNVSGHPKLYALSITIAYGGNPDNAAIDKDVFEFKATVASCSNPAYTDQASCTTNGGTWTAAQPTDVILKCGPTESFCAIAELHTKVYKHVD